MRVIYMHLYMYLYIFISRFIFVLHTTNLILPAFAITAKDKERKSLSCRGLAWRDGHLSITDSHSHFY